MLARIFLPDHTWATRLERPKQRLSILFSSGNNIVLVDCSFKTAMFLLSLGPTAFPFTRILPPVRGSSPSRIPTSL